MSATANLCAFRSSNEEHSKTAKYRKCQTRPAQAVARGQHVALHATSVTLPAETFQIPCPEKAVIGSRSNLEKFKSCLFMHTYITLPIHFVQMY
jgi:hypothetical protein